LILLVLRLVVSDRQGSALVLLSPQFRSSFAAGQQIVRDEAARVAAMPGDIFCRNKLVCRAAGKPFVVDEFKMEELVATGKATDADIAALLNDRHIRVFISDPKTLTSSADTSLSAIWRKRD
jgi:hypothetical protein